MDNKRPIPRFIPYLVAVVTFISVSLIYFSPVIEGKKLPMHDITQYEGMGRDIVEHQQKYGEDPQWAGRMFSGMPSALISTSQPSLIFKIATRTIEGFASPASLIFLAMVGFFILVLLCGINPWVGIIPSLAYGLSTYFFLIIGAGHITKMVAAAYAPMVLGGIFYAFRKDLWLGAGLTALFLSIEIAASHPQITYYFGLIALAFWINELCVALKEKWTVRFAKITGVLLLAAVLGIGSNFAPLYGVQSYSKYSMRGGSELAQDKNDPNQTVSDKGLSLDYATHWSYGVAESFNMFIPDFMGGSSFGGFSEDGPVAQRLVNYNARNMATQLPGYWGDQPMTGGPTYLGAVAIFLAVAGLFVIRGRYKWWIVAVGALAVMLAWGNNFMPLTKLFFNFFPGYNKFRTVTMILVVVQWAVPFLGALFLYKLWKGLEPKELKRAALNSLYITGGIAAFFLLLGGLFFDFSSPNDLALPGEIGEAMRMERASMFRWDCFRSLVFVGLTALVLLVYVPGWIKKGGLLVMLAVLVCLDLIPVNMRYLPQSNFVQPRNMTIKPTEADLEILADTTPGFRVANFTVSTFADASTSYFHRSVGGYHGAKLQRYQDLIDRYLQKGTPEVYDMLNTRYFITPGKEQGDAPIVKFNYNANGAAWFVQGALWADTPQEEIDALGVIDTKRVAVVEGRYKSLTDPVIWGQEYDSGDDSVTMAGTAMLDPQTDEITLTDYRVNRQTYHYKASEQRLAVFSEIYYKDGWSATLDGQPLDYMRADYVLRAAVLPAGEHTVVFSFAIPHFKTLSAITLVCSLLILVWIAVAWLVPRYVCKKKEDGQQQE